MPNGFRDSLTNSNEFTVTWEMVPGRGAKEKGQEDVLKAAAKATATGKIHAISVTDNPGGLPAISPDVLSVEIASLGIEPLVHLTCKDKNRNQIEGQLHGLARSGLRNLLVMSGDFPVDGYLGRPKPVFDLDPIHTLSLIKDLNDGLITSSSKNDERLAKTEFFAGAAVSPFKQTEAELLPQYFKLEKKLRAGAGFIVTQLGFDARKFHEVLTYLKSRSYEVPVIGNIYVLTFGAAKAMNQNSVPGCVVTEELVKRLDSERGAGDKGKQARLLRAAKMYAFMKGMGFSGVHIGGFNLKVEDIISIIDQGEELAHNWQEYLPEFDLPQPDGFYLFHKDDHTGLNTAEPMPLSKDIDKGLGNRAFRLLHKTVFDKKGIFYRPMKGIAHFVDEKPLGEAYAAFEHIIKTATNGCMRCGDCALTDLAYICPMSQCPKNQRNGPCGGSSGGWCEVFPNKRKCLYVRAYRRLKAYGETRQLEENTVPPCNWKLSKSCSWLNFFLERDHLAGR